MGVKIKRFNTKPLEYFSDEQMHAIHSASIDMQSMQPTYSAPEGMMTQAGLCQIGRCLYQLPTWGFGGCSASKLADEQAVNEASSYIMMAEWAGRILSTTSATWNSG